MRKDLVVLDTDVFVSAFVFSGFAELVLQKAVDDYTLCFSVDLVKEVVDKLANKFVVGQDVLDRFYQLIEKSYIFMPEIKLDICKDKDDNFILELASESRAKYIVTGDKKHLLPMGKWNSSIIVSLREFWDL